MRTAFLTLVAFLGAFLIGCFAATLPFGIMDKLGLVHEREYFSGLFVLVIGVFVGLIAGCAAAILVFRKQRRREAQRQSARGRPS
jgi:hypothetical protein